MSRTWEVYKQDDKLYIKGMFGDEWNRTYALAAGMNPDHYLLYFSKYPDTETPEVDAAKNADEVHGALYDLYQCNDEINKGDIFITPVGKFYAVSVHIMTEEEYKNWKEEESNEE